MPNYVVEVGTYNPLRELFSIACPALEDNITEALMYRQTVSIADNPVESRLRPTDLVMNPTPQALQSTHRKWGGCWERGPVWDWQPYCFDPPGYHLFPTYDQQLDYNVYPIISLGDINPDWQTKMRLDIKDMAVNLGNTLIEYRETAGLFRDFATKTRDAWQLFKGKKKSRQRLRPCDVAAAELLTSFAVMPLATTLADSVLTLQERLGSPIIRRFVSTAAEESDFSNENYTGRYRVSHRAIAYVRLNPDNRQFIFGNPLELGWEIVPFSFVVDWAIPIGDYLSSLDALTGVDGLAGTVTKKHRYSHESHPSSLKSAGYYPLVKAKTTYASHERVVMTGIPLPRVPTWNPSKSWRAIMHGISLLTTLNHRCRQSSR